jgi:hypothetical protein
MDTQTRLEIILIVSAVTWPMAVFYAATRSLLMIFGRYLFYAIIVWGALMAMGIDTWLLPVRAKGRMILSLLSISATVAALCLFGYFYPAFQPLPAEHAPQKPLGFTYEGTATLTGMSPSTPQARPGETIAITLTWRAITPTSRSLMVYLHSAFAENIVWRDSYPATGNLLSTEWAAGQTWSERYMIAIPPDAIPGQTYLLVAGLYDPADQRQLLAVNQSGENSGPAPVIGDITIVMP